MIADISLKLNKNFRFERLLTIIRSSLPAYITNQTALITPKSPHSKILSSITKKKPNEPVLTTETNVEKTIDYSTLEITTLQQTSTIKPTTISNGNY